MGKGNIDGKSVEKTMKDKQGEANISGEAGRIREGIARGEPLRFYFEGLALSAYEGETVAGALLAAGIRTLRHALKQGQPRGWFCGMGACFECRMMIDGRPNVRACMTLVRQDMRVRTGKS